MDDLNRTSRPYSKPHLTFDDQIALLRNRGLIIDELAVAQEALASIGYYRLSWYLFDFRPNRQNPSVGQSLKDDTFLAGTTLDHVLALYEFDRRLRQLILDGMERIEVAARVRIAYECGRPDPFAYYNPNYVNPTSHHVRITAAGQEINNYDEWMTRYDRLLAESREAFIVSYRRKYGDASPRPPIWIASELWDFGCLSRYYSYLLPEAAKISVAEAFGVAGYTMFAGWLHTLNVVRNLAAHHARVWNCQVPIPPALPKKRGMIPAFDHLCGNRQDAAQQVYASLVIMSFLISQMEAGKSWLHDARVLFDAFPIVPAHSLAMAGFPSGWQLEWIWNWSQDVAGAPVLIGEMGRSTRG